MRSPTETLLLEDVHPLWHFTRPVPSEPSVIDSILLIREPAVARTRGRPMGSTIQLPNQADLTEEVNFAPEAVVSTIDRQNETSTQRNPSQYEIAENIVPERHQASTRGRVVGRVAARGSRGLCQNYHH